MNHPGPKIDKDKDNLTFLFEFPKSTIVLDVEQEAGAFGPICTLRFQVFKGFSTQGQLTSVPQKIESPQNKYLFRALKKTFLAKSNTLCPKCTGCPKKIPFWKFLRLDPYDILGPVWINSWS